MFVSDRILFLELHKTGCTHIGKLLARIVPGEQIGKHNQAPRALLDGSRRILGSVRSPWDWYVSLWAYGCDSRGAVFTATTRHKVQFRGLGWKRTPLHAAHALLSQLVPQGGIGSLRRWKRTYRDVEDAGCFRAWLSLVHDPSQFECLGEGYAGTPLSSIAGFLTYRYMRLYTCAEGEFDEVQLLSTPEELRRFEADHCFVDYFVRNERLRTDLIAALKQFGIPVDSAQERMVLDSGRTNTSSRKHPPGYYYDEPSAELVRQRDRVLVEKFDYSV